MKSSSVDYMHRLLAESLYRGYTGGPPSHGEATALAVGSHGGWERVTGTPATDLQILRHRGTAYLTYRVQIRQFEAGFDPAIFVVFIDAKTGDQVWKYNDLAHEALSDADKVTYDVNNGTNKKDHREDDAKTTIGRPLDLVLTG